MSRRLWLVMLLVLGVMTREAVSGDAADQTMPFDAASASLDTLVFHMQRFGTTPAKKRARRAAKQELVERGTNALDYLMRYAHVDNGGIQQQIFKLAWTHLPEEEVVPLLMGFVEVEDAKIRKMAIFLLGKFEMPEGVERLMPALDEDETAGATIRTLGKWRYEPARAKIEIRLQDDKERRRILAVNALRDIGNPESLPLLIGALSDPTFTVRKAAREAVVSFGHTAEQPVLDALRQASRVPRREMLGILGEVGGRRSRRALKSALKSDDPAIRRDAARALERL